MSGNQWSGDDYETDEDDTDSGGIKNLRKEFDRVKKENADLKARAEKAEAATRRSSVEDILRAKDVNPRVAKLIPSDVEATEEGIKSWLEEFADVFNVKGSASDADGGPVPGGTQAEPALSKDDVTALNRVAAASQGATVDMSKAQAILGQVQSAKTPEEFYALMEQHGVGKNTAGG